MFSLSYISRVDISSITLTLSGRTIYKAKINEKDCPAEDILSQVLVCVSKGARANHLWVVYQNLDLDYCIAPVYDHQEDAVLKNRHLLNEPTNIRFFYEMLDL